MKGFKDTTRTHYSMGGVTTGPKGAAKVSQVMREWGAGRLHSGSKKGPVVKDQKQAVAIALNQAGKTVDKASGGTVTPIGHVQPPAGALPTMMAKRSLGANTAALKRALMIKAAMAAKPKPQPMIQNPQIPVQAGPMIAPQGGAAPFKRGGRVMKKADGGLSTSVPRPDDANEAANSFVNERANQLREVVGKAKGGKVGKFGRW